MNESVSAQTASSTNDANARPAITMSEPLDARVVLLTHYVPLYQLPIYQQLANRIADFRVLLSTKIEPNRHFEPRWDGLNVNLQKTVTLKRRWKHDAGFNDTLYVHLPYDTTWQLRRLKPDVVLSLELGFRSCAASIYRMLHRRSRLILCTFMSEHTERGRGVMRAATRRALIRRADALTYNGPSCHRVLRKLGADDHRLFPFPYAANPACVYDGVLETRPPAALGRLLYVGQMNQRKGVQAMFHQVVDFARRHPNQPLRLTMIGEGPLRESLTRRETPENLQTHFVGNVPAERLPEHLSQQDAMIFPTLADEWGLVVNEALHSWLPVIGSSLAQASTTLIEEGVNGWLYDPRDPSQLASCLKRWLACDQASIARMQVACRRSVRERTPEAACDGLLNAINFVLERQRGKTKSQNPLEDIDA
ncbi:MAG: glycosyltransferase family 4 protein [Pirellulaceae bacterium]